MSVGGRPRQSPNSMSWFRRGYNIERRMRLPACLTQGTLGGKEGKRTSGLRAAGRAGCCRGLGLRHAGRRGVDGGRSSRTAGGILTAWWCIDGDDESVFLDDVGVAATCSIGPFPGISSLCDVTDCAPVTHGKRLVRDYGGAQQVRFRLGCWLPPTGVRERDRKLRGRVYDSAVKGNGRRVAVVGRPCPERSW